MNQGTFAGKFWELLILGAKILEDAPNLNHQEETDPGTQRISQEGSRISNLLSWKMLDGCHSVCENPEWVKRPCCQRHSHTWFLCFGYTVRPETLKEGNGHLTLPLPSLKFQSGCTEWCGWRVKIQVCLANVVVLYGPDTVLHHRIGRDTAQAWP